MKKIKTVPVEYIESGTFCGGEEDCYNAKIDDNQSYLVIEEGDYALLRSELRKANRLAAEAGKEYDAIRRHQINLYQDSCEGALIEVSYYDAVRQALSEISPDHPVLKGMPPTFGVWEAQRKEIERLHAALTPFANFASVHGCSKTMGRGAEIAASEWQEAINLVGNLKTS